MSNLSEKTTIYLNPSVKKFIRHKAVAEDRSVSDVINEQFAEMLEDLDDICALAEIKLPMYGHERRESDYFLRLRFK